MHNRAVGRVRSSMPPASMHRRALEGLSKHAITEDAQESVEGDLVHCS